MFVFVLLACRLAEDYVYPAPNTLPSKHKLSQLIGNVAVLRRIREVSGKNVGSEISDHATFSPFPRYVLLMKRMIDERQRWKEWSVKNQLQFHSRKFSCICSL
jgi:hypothetical protein